jgi:hypothetical protein
VIRIAMLVAMAFCTGGNCAEVERRDQRCGREDRRWVVVFGTASAQAFLHTLRLSRGRAVYERHLENIFLRL